jgi:esterase/lipase superfamily enzyme
MVIESSVRRRRRQVALAWVMVMTTGCAAASKSAKPPPNPPADVMRIYYATDRAPVQTKAPFFGGERSGLRLGRAEVGVLINDRPGGSAVRRPATTRPAQRDDHWVRDVQELSAQRLVADASDGVGGWPVLIFVHGYNVAPESAMATAAQLAYDVGFEGAVIAFVWPSRAALDSYSSDEESAQWAAPHLAELIRHLKNRPERPVHIIAHSMGSRVACGALQRLACGGGRDATTRPAPKLGRFILAAADIDADIFKAQIVDEIRPLVTSITLYASRDDAALRVSEQLHKWTRAGETGDWMPAGETRFEMIDCSGIDLSKRTGSSVIGHSYYSEDDVAQDMQSVLGTSTAPRTAQPTAGGRYLRIPPKRSGGGFAWR